MSKFAKSIDSSHPQNTLKPPPDLCMIDGCQEKTDVVIARVRRGGRILIGAFSEFGTAAGKSLTLKPEIFFDSWICRCSHHYQKDVDRARSMGIGKFKPRKAVSTMTEKVKDSFPSKLSALLKEHNFGGRK